MDRTVVAPAPRRARALLFPTAFAVGAALALALAVTPAHAQSEAAADAPAPSGAAATAPSAPPAGAPAAKPKAKNSDPFERVNRATYAFNDALDRMFARPAAKAYKRVVPEPGRIAISNAMGNLEYPTTVLNSALQGKLKDAGQDLARFVVNSTIGIAGLWDPATKFGLPRHDEDFGQTLGRWGVPTGPYLVMPFFGPSNFRDAPGRFADRYTNVRRYINGSNGNLEVELLALDVLDTRAQLLAAGAALDSAFDPYALVRNAYLQRREYLVKDGQVAEEQYDEPYDEPMDEAAPESSEAAPPASDGSAPAAPSDAAAPASIPAAPPSGSAPPGAEPQAAS
jgi:phospholipid-binding lipoprotein MlaA